MYSLRVYEGTYQMCQNQIKIKISIRVEFVQLTTTNESGCTSRRGKGLKVTDRAMNTVNIAVK
jgi:hypothetical protein